MPQMNVLHEFDSLKDTYCPVSEGFNHIFGVSPEVEEAGFELPTSWGSGRFRRITISRSLELCLNNLQLLREVRITGRTRGPVYVMIFCLGEDMAWDEAVSKTSLQLGSGEGMLYQIEDVTEICTYIPKRYYQGISVIIHPERFAGLLSALSVREKLFSRAYGNYKINHFELPAESKIITEQMLRCPYKSAIKNMYLEGKTLEILSVCLHQLTLQNHERASYIKLSKNDMNSLRQAKEILDNSISSPLSLAALAKLVCLNEFKLKNGFKQVFDKPVYTYLLDKRLESARVLLEIHGLSVSEAAEVVGYSNGSSFSKAFRKKYGFSPGLIKNADGND